jgi:hypothetical protein
MGKVDEHWGGLTKSERDERRKRPQTIGDHEARLEEGWAWLRTHPNHRGAEHFFHIWEGWLHAYQDAYREATRGTQAEMAL